MLSLTVYVYLISKICRLARVCVSHVKSTVLGIPSVERATISLSVGEWKEGTTRMPPPQNYGERTWEGGGMGLQSRSGPDLCQPTLGYTLYQAPTCDRQSGAMLPEPPADYSLKLLDFWFMVKWGNTYMPSLRHTHKITIDVQVQILNWAPLTIHTPYGTLWFVIFNLISYLSYGSYNHVALYNSASKPKTLLILDFINCYIPQFFVSFLYWVLHHKYMTIWPFNSTPGHLSGEKHGLKGYRHPCVHWSTVYNSQDMQAN